jgi:hypothetical protein
MNNPTWLLFGLDSFTGRRYRARRRRGLRVVIETSRTTGWCPRCGGCQGGEGPAAGRDPGVCPPRGGGCSCGGRMRRLRCLQGACRRGSFTRTAAAIPPRARLTARRREHLACAVAGSNRAVDEVASEHGGVLADGAPGAGRRRRRLAATTGTGLGARHRRDPRPVGPLGARAGRVAPQRPVADLVRQRRHHRPRRVAESGSRTHRGLREDLAGRADTGLP